LNSDYEAKRYKGITLEMPEITVARPNLFYDWLESKGKLGGQHKIPRLSNNREIMDSLLSYKL
ncbi:MAG: GH3 auxin-responsive promoter family protein, partial [Dysgonamonadaceae bacterium]|nr:GH3 auxin-responsive promoter family protein [Dysgonamonadaceae bacterium]